MSVRFKYAKDPGHAYPSSWRYEGYPCRREVMQGIALAQSDPNKVGIASFVTMSGENSNPVLVLKLEVMLATT